MKTNLLLIILMFGISIFNEVKAQTDMLAPITPQGVQAFGYEKNVDVEWYKACEE